MSDKNNQKELHEVQSQKDKGRLDELGQRVMPPPPEKQVALNNDAIKSQRVPPPPPEPEKTPSPPPTQTEKTPPPPTSPTKENSNTGDSK